eukprot:552333-Pelagomonas_calceolata.AAC.3
MMLWRKSAEMAQACSDGETMLWHKLAEMAQASRDGGVAQASRKDGDIAQDHGSRRFGTG